MKIKIESSGLGSGTKVTTPEGWQVPNVTKLEILPIEPGSVVTAVVSMVLVGLDIEAEAILALDVVEASAAYHGFKLVPLMEAADDPQAGA